MGQMHDTSLCPRDPKAGAIFNQLADTDRMPAVCGGSDGALGTEQWATPMGAMGSSSAEAPHLGSQPSVSSLLWPRIRWCRASALQTIRPTVQLPYFVPVGIQVGRGHLSAPPWG